MCFKPTYLLPLLVLTLLLAGCPGTRTMDLAVDPMAGVVRYDYSGIRIAQQYNGRGYVHVRLYLERGPALADPGREGLESLAIAAALGAGAGDMDGSTFAARLEALGATVRHSTGKEYSVIALDCLPGQEKRTWEVFSKALLEPRFGAEEFAEIRAAQSAWLEAEAKRPGLEAEMAARTAAFGEGWGPKPGTAQKVASYTREEARVYFVDELMQKCRIVLLTSGPLESEALADLLLDNLDLLPGGDCQTPAIEEPLPRAAALQAIAGEEGGGGTPIQYVSGVLVREDNAGERVALRQTLAWLIESRLEDRFEEAGLDCPVAIRVLPQTGFPLEFSLNGRRGMACTELALSELRLLRANGLTDEEWASLRREALSRALLARESAEGALVRLAECILSGTWESCALDVNLMQKLSTKSINSLIRKEMKGIALAYQGDTTKLDRKVLANF